MKLYKLSSILDRYEALKKLDVTAAGITILKDKMGCELYLIKGLKTPAANILKQDALSIGADLAVPKDTIECKRAHVDVLLIATQTQIKKLSKKELAQPFGLKGVAQELQRYAQESTKELKIMGVINANSDSFYEGSRFHGESALMMIEQMIGEGADIIDIGGVSSRPGSEAVSAREELERVQAIIDTIYAKKLYEKVRFSIDSYAPKVVSYALERGFTIVNDITGLADDDVVKLAGEYRATAVIMHMQGRPQTMQNDPIYANVLGDIADFFEERVAKARSYGIDEIVLDVGIGFGKTLEHNLMLVKHLGHFKKFGCELLVGASRKSMIDAIVPSAPHERLPGTLALHLESYKNGASIIRCHDVREHYQAFQVQHALDRTLF
jgi:dihydropteroate synthase